MYLLHTDVAETVVPNNDGGRSNGNVGVNNLLLLLSLLLLSTIYAPTLDSAIPLGPLLAFPFASPFLLAPFSLNRKKKSK